MTPLLTFLAAGILLGVVAVYLVREAIEYEKQYKILINSTNRKELSYNNGMTAEQLLNLITTQTFADFYNNDLEDFINGEGNAMSKEDIIGNLKELMNFRR